MKYLMRAARRLSTAGAPKVRPAMPSRSPLAEADQRLNIESFASRFDVPVVPERAEPAPEENERAPFGGSDRGMRNHPAAGPTWPAVEPAMVPSEPVVPAVQSEPQGDNAPARGRPGRDAPARASPPSTTRSAGPRKQAVARDSEPPPFPQTATVLPDRPTSEPPAARVNALFHPATVEGRSPAPERPRIEPANAATRVLERKGPTDTMLDAMNRAMSWVEGQARRPRAAERGERTRDPSSPGSQPRLGERVRARPIREAPRDSRPIVHLEIGKIEVEVVPPVKPPRNVAPPRPGPRASRPTFGSRQR